MTIKSVKVKVASREGSNEALEMNWYEMPGALYGFENNPAFLEKMEIDEVDENLNQKTASAKKPSRKQRECSWVRKRHHKEKLARRRLSEHKYGVWVKSNGYFDFWDYDPEIDPDSYRNVFITNPSQKLKMHGDGYCHDLIWFYIVSTGKKDVKHFTNRRIRQYARFDKEMVFAHSSYKKFYNFD